MNQNPPKLELSFHIILLRTERKLATYTRVKLAELV